MKHPILIVVEALISGEEIAIRNDTYRFKAGILEVRPKGSSPERYRTSSRSLSSFIHKAEDMSSKELMAIEAAAIRNRPGSP